MGVPPSQDRALALESAAPMFVAGEDLTVVEWNAAAEALLGFPRAEVLGRPCHELLGCPDPAREAPRACGECFEREIATRSGGRAWVSVTTLRADAGRGGPLRVHLLRELTPQRRLEDLLRQVVSAASEVVLAPPSAAHGPRSAHEPEVTEREREVIRLLAQGSSTRAIASRLGITCRTARNHIQNVLCKLRVHSRVEAVATASARGLV